MELTNPSLHAMSDASPSHATAPSKPAAPRRGRPRGGAAADTGANESATGEALATPGRPLADILSDLQKPIPRRLLETKKIQGQPITYCPWYRVQKILDHYTGGRWEYEIRERTITSQHLMLTVRIYIHTAEGVFYREGTGIEHIDVDSFGDPQSNAESMAFRRAAAKWGLGLDLYDE